LNIQYIFEYFARNSQTSKRFFAQNSQTSKRFLREIPKQAKDFCALFSKKRLEGEVVGDAA
jgi:hypothetical protein